MSLQTKVWTYEDLLETPDDGRRYEIIDGELFVSASPSLEHQATLGEIYDLVKGFVRVNDLGRVFFAPLDVFFSDINVVEPDLLFVSRVRFAASGPARIEGPPDLVVEVLSPSTKRIDLTRKQALYASFGVPEYWIIDPDAETVRMLFLEAGEDVEQSPDESGRLHSRVLVGLAFDPAVIFSVV